MAQNEKQINPEIADPQFQSQAGDELLAVIAELQHAFQLADNYRGKQAQAYWAASAERARASLSQLVASLPQLAVFDEHGLNNLRDALESSLLGVRVHREQFARVQWIVKAPRALLARLTERQLVQSWLQAPTEPWVWTDSNIVTPAPAGFLFATFCL